jgi:hypothetical protein
MASVVEPRASVPESRMTSGAYAMLGLVAELRIHKIVDIPNWVVGCMPPRRLF